MVKDLPAMRETWIQSLGWEDPLEKGIAAHSRIPAWRSPWKRCLAGSSLPRCEESNMTEQLTHRNWLLFPFDRYW